ncbi:DUF4215 domain-containing protein [Polyangium mundeleinium]|uniref:DUF4215 domain-containing protein n=1 Tax=Polyangium mundeleinium TaxID=2995306 RepID=A0ABT5EN31_9BACT|nr:DUF4215 domain-containing protein [Polyangium mundeleinium]MDC0743151.1 hypothetical protein [Polyangium mundeleinium]
MTLALTLGALMAALAGCPDDAPLPPDTTGGAGNGGSGGMASSCGDGILDMGETCDDGNNTDGDGCSACAVDACYTCDANAPSACTPKAAGEACEGTKLCNEAGQCVECIDNSQCGTGYCFQDACAACDDTVKNGDETDVDCGGTHCGLCEQGKTCVVGADCTSTFCADGVCCDGACDDACFSCSLAGTIGECSAIPKYAEDPSYGMGEACLAAEGEECSGLGTCGKAVGQSCTNNPECATVNCKDPDLDGTKTCVKNNGEPCSAASECASNNCMDGACAM